MVYLSVVAVAVAVAVAVVIVIVIVTADSDSVPTHLFKRQLGRVYRVYVL